MINIIGTAFTFSVLLRCHVDCEHLSKLIFGERHSSRTCTLRCLSHRILRAFSMLAMDRKKMFVFDLELFEFIRVQIFSPFIHEREFCRQLLKKEEQPSVSLI